MMIPKDKIEEVRDRASIVQVISDYVPLQKRGANYLGLCPFHSEKTPSFSVNEEKSIYYCFGCNATGNVITFLMNREGMSFPEAVVSLADRFGVVIPKEAAGPPDKRDELFAALKAASEFFFKSLRSSEGKAARDYFKSRGFDQKAAEEFKVGLAPDSWDALGKYLKAAGVSADAALRAGLVVKKESGGAYDRFRGRLIFPIIDTRGRTIGFGGRILGPGEPKYLNSPESPVFRKGETLYGFYQAKQAIMKEKSAIVVEGYFDLLALHAAGFANTVATMGTALTREHLRFLKGYAETIYALFDSDEAGRKAAVRGLPLFLAEEVDCRAVLLDGAKDPDEFLSKNGPEAMRASLKKAAPLMEFCLDELKRGLDLSEPLGKRKYLDGALEYLSQVGNVAERGHYVSIVALELGITPAAVHGALKMPKEKAAVVLDRKAGRKSANLAELTILKVIVRHPELFTPAVEEAFAAFTDPVLKEAAMLLVPALKAGGGLDASFMDEIGQIGGSAEALSTLARMLFGAEEDFIESPGRMMEDCLKRVLNKGKIKETTRGLIDALAEAGLSEAASEIERRLGKGVGGFKKDGD